MPAYPYEPIAVKDYKVQISVDQTKSHALSEAAFLLGSYANFIATVKADDIEQHPYLPRIQDAILDLRNLEDGATEWGYGADINMPSDSVLLFRGVSSARPVRDVRRGVPRWRAVMEAFQLGSTYATALCERFRLDPEEKVRR